MTPLAIGTPVIREGVGNTTFKCEVCGNDFIGKNTMMLGEQECVVCGTPYQLFRLDPHGEHPIISDPHIPTDKGEIPYLKEYWEETHKIHRWGDYFDEPEPLRERREFKEWFDRKHPYLLERE